MARNVIGLITGLVIGFMVIAGIQMINYALFPIPASVDQSSPEEMKAYIDTLPTLAFVIVVISHLVGSFVSAFVGSKIAERNKLAVALGIGGFFMVMGVINMFQISHPTWFYPIDLLTYLPFAYLGHRIASRF